MKKCALVFVLLSIVTSGVGQSRPNQKDAPPTQKEMEAMMNEMQQEMGNLDPETKRAMDSMGIQMPSLNSIPKMTDAEIREAYENENRIVPLKDVSRIGSISKSPLTNATLGAFLATTHGKVALQLKAASKSKGEEIYKQAKAQYNSDAATGNTAAGLWMAGRAELALYVMGKACIDNPINTDNLNNYASMLSMSGAEQLSIPILNYVNKRFPRNSTVLNNIGQAWFGLGDIDKANSYLDSAIRLYPFHPQANYTKSFIEEGRGNKTAAIESAKRSIKRAYTQKKEDRLNKLGYKLKSDDVYWNRPMPADALGLEKFNWPDYPKNVEMSENLEKEWNAFRASCRAELEGLRAQQQKLEAAMVSTNQKRTNDLLAASKKGVYMDPVPPLAPIAMVKLKYLIDGKDGHLAVSYQKKQEAIAKAVHSTADLEEKESDQMEVIRQNYEDKFGEGKPNPFDAACSDENAARSAFLAASNSQLQQTFSDYLNFLRRKLNDEVYYYQYTQWPEQFEVTKVHAKITWLSAIQEQKVMFRNKSSWCQEKTTAIEQKDKKKLAAFDDIHCQYHSELKTPVGTIRTDCSRMTTELDLKVIKLGLKQDMDRETFGDQFMSCSVEVGVGTGAGVNTGPLKAEASIGASLAAEFDRTGLTDVIVKTSAGVSAGTDIISGGSIAGVGVSDLSVDVGVKGQISLISGKSSAESTGLLDGVFKK